MAKLKKFIYLLVITIIRPLRLLFKKHASSVAFLPPAPPGSIGDEAMVLSLISELRKKGAKNIALIDYKPNKKWQLEKSVEYGLVLPRNLLEWLAFLWQLSAFESLFVIGADVLDGKYSILNSVLRIRVANYGDRLGLKTTITGFSFREDPPASTVYALRDLRDTVKLFARDPVSLKRLQGHGLKQTELVADLAFLLESALSSKKFQELKTKIRAKVPEGATLIGVNFNRQVLESTSAEDVLALAKAYIEILERLTAANANLFIVLVPHDSRNEYSDLEMAKYIYKNFAEGTRSRSFVIEEILHADEIKAVASLLDFALTGRKHFAVACIGNCIPVCGVTYQDKFEGLYGMFGMEDLLVSADKVLRDKEAVIILLQKMIDSKHAYNLQIEAALDGVKKMSKLNFNQINY